MIKKTSNDPLKYTVDDVEQAAITHNHAVCSGDCSVPFDFLYITNGEEKIPVQYNSDFCPACTCWKTE